MKTTISICSLVFAIIIMPFSKVSAQWVQTSGPFGGGGMVRAFGSLSDSTDSSYLFAGAYLGGVFRSSDNGETWTTINTGLTDTDINCFAALGTNLFVGTAAGVFHSSNEGTTWSASSTGLTNTYIFSLVVSGANLFAGTNNGVFLSTDNGANWIKSGLRGYGVNVLAISGSNLLAGTNYGGVFLSTNNGASWTNPNKSGSRTNCLAVSGTNIFAGTSDGIFRSTDSGTNWTMVTPLSTIPEVISLTFSGTKLFAGTNGICLSTDNGVNWTVADSGISVYSLFVSGGKIFAGTWVAGIIVSTNDGTSWSEVDYTDVNVNALAVSGTYILAGTQKGIFLSTNGGKNWTLNNSGMPTNAFISSFALSGGNLFAGGLGLYLSTNSGFTWTQPGSTSFPIARLAVLGSDLFAGSLSGIYRSTDNGISWTADDSGSTLLPELDVWSFAISGKNIYAGTDGGYVYLSTDNGGSWRVVLTGGAFYALTVSGADIFAACTAHSGGTHIYLSTDNGASWTVSDSGLAGVSVHSFVVSGDNIFAGTDGAGIYISANHGTNWRAVNSGLQEELVFNDLICSGTDLFAATSAGVWRRPISEMTNVKTSHVEIPTTFSLLQNYPNPFNPATTISFNLSSKVFVSVMVFDIVGREVATIVSEEMRAGQYSRQWDASKQSSGVYFCRLQAGAFTETKKLVLLK